MQVIVKLFNVNGIPASDGSIIPRRVVEEYLASDKYKNDVATGKMLGSLTHRCRSLATQKKYDPSISKCIGKDDALLTVGLASPTHVVNKIWIDDSNGWVYVKATILDEKGMDDEAIQNIRRIKGLLSQKILVSTSGVILGYWEKEGGKDILRRCVAIRGFDWTLNASWTDSCTEVIIDDDGEVIAEHRFSDTTEGEGDVSLKMFSEEELNIPKSSKIDGHYTVLKAKSYSSNSFIDVSSDIEERSYSVASIKERVRYTKLGPRQRFRRLFIEYKAYIRQAGGVEKLDPEEEKILRSLFMTDVLDIFKGITGEVMEGKQINTLIGASSLGKNVRVAAQKLQLPCKIAFTEMSKKGTLTPMRMKQLQEAYTEFSKAMCEEVFGDNPIPEGLEEEVEEA